MFSDLNRFVAKTSKSLDILYDKRDPVSQATLKITEAVPVFEGMVDKDAVSLPARSPKLFTLSALYDANSELLHAGDDDDDASINQLVSIGTDFWKTVAMAMPDWRKVKAGHLRSVELRQESTCSHTVVLRAIGAAGAELLTVAPEDWREHIRRLQDIDWSKQNKDW